MSEISYILLPGHRCVVMHGSIVVCNDLTCSVDSAVSSNYVGIVHDLMGLRVYWQRFAIFWRSGGHRHCILNCSDTYISYCHASVYFRVRSFCHCVLYSIGIFRLLERFSDCSKESHLFVYFSLLLHF